MSAYMVSNENLCKIAGYLAAVLNGTEYKGTCEGAKAFWFSQDFVKTFKAIPGAYDDGLYKAKPIHRALYDMNRNALLARYRECNTPYERFDATFGTVDTKEETREEWQSRLFTIIRNYLYPCEEGNVPETALFKAVREFEEVLAYSIAVETARRDWGCRWSSWKPEEKGERESKMRD